MIADGVVLEHWRVVAGSTCALVGYVAAMCWLYAFTKRRNAERARARVTAGGVDATSLAAGGSGRASETAAQKGV